VTDAPVGPLTPGDNLIASQAQRERARILAAIESLFTLGFYRFDTDEQCARIEALLWDSLPKYAATLNERAWHVLVWSRDGYNLLLYRTRQGLNNAVKREYLLRIARGARDAEARAYRRAFQQLTR